MARSLGLERDSNGNWVKYDGKAGRVFVPALEGGVREIVGLRAIFDFARIRTGWIDFPSGRAPSFIEDAALGHRGPKPGDHYKRGFRLNLFSEKQLGGVREMMGNSGVLTDAINTMFQQYDDAPESRQGLVPVVSLQAVTPVQSQTPQGQTVINYAPVFVIDTWVPRPAALDAPPPAPVGTPQPDEFASELRVPAGQIQQAAHLPAAAPAPSNVAILPPRNPVTPGIEDEFGPSRVKAPGGAA